MHCVAEYPTPDEALQVNQIELLRARYPGVRVAIPHESPDNTFAVGLALAKGASVFEARGAAHRQIRRQRLLRQPGSDPRLAGRLPPRPRHLRQQRALPALRRRAGQPAFPCAGACSPPATSPRAA